LSIGKSARDDNIEKTALSSSLGMDRCSKEVRADVGALM